MHKLIAGIVALSMLALAAHAQTGLTYVPCGYQQITSLSSAQALTVPTAGCGRVTMAVIAVEGAAIRWRDDGNNPTASVGIPVSSGQTFSYSATLANIRIIEQAASATINVSYYR